LDGSHGVFLVTLFKHMRRKKVESSGCRHEVFPLI
jgi:hypothetical protein